MNHCYALVRRRLDPETNNEYTKVVDVTFKSSKEEATRCFRDFGYALFPDMQVVDIGAVLNQEPIRPETVPAPYNEPITALYVRLT